MSSKALINEIIETPQQTINQTKKRIAATPKNPVSKKPIDLKATIQMVHGKQKIADNKQSFEKMSDKYGKWVLKQES